ncbi:Short transient receptor potential channel 2 homolog [Lemmus lemmus]
MFGMEEHKVVDMPQFLVPEFVGRALYGIFTIVMVIVLLNMLIAMITNSFQKIEVGGLSRAAPGAGLGQEPGWARSQAGPGAGLRQEPGCARRRQQA